MPEAAMHQNDSSISREHQIRTAWQIRSVKPESKAARMKAPPHEKFRLGITTTNAAHIERALIRCQNIDHCPETSGDSIGSDRAQRLH
jgi:hypothetical protein